MNAPCCTITAEAASWISRMVRVGLTDTTTAGLLPALHSIFGYQLWDRNRRILEAHSGEFVDVGWYDPKTVADRGFSSIEVNGLTVYILRQTLLSIR